MRQKVLCYVLLFSAVLGHLTGCAGLNDRGQRLLSSKVPAFAIVNEQLVVGEMELFPSRTGTVVLQVELPASAWGADSTTAVVTPTKPLNHPLLTSCLGRFSYTGTTMGTIDLRCNDGAVADLTMALMGDTHGYGYGRTASGLASLTFGLTPAQARAHLTVPPNMKLLERTDSDGLELK